MVWNFSLNLRLLSHLFYLRPLDQTVLRDVVESEGPPDLLVQRLCGEIQAKHELSEVDVAVPVKVKSVEQLNTELNLD